ncbi:MAG: hypothetical protein IPL49_16790 [Saprospirales bacterium]|nr:hypothetical protein [Saprospirales bacterium]MBK8492492.1 hypothetical protein [Saprospirales bacterium]
METQKINSPLNNTQLEILKLFSREMSEQDLLEIKRLIVRFLAQKVTALADEVWKQKSWTNEDMEKILQMHERTPYNPSN